MSEIKILIVEDEAIIAENLRCMLEDLGYSPYNPVDKLQNAIDFLESNEVDLAILDINLKGKHDGIEIGKYIHENKKLPFIYLTSNADKATIDKAKHTFPSTYLIKPFTEEDIYAAIEVAINFKTSNPDQHPEEKLPMLNDCIFIKQNNRFYKVKFDDITYVKSEDKYLDIITKNNTKYVARIPLEAFISQLNSQKFIRIHRSYVINLNFLDSINGNEVSVNSVDIPIGRLYRDELLLKINTLS